MTEARSFFTVQPVDDRERAIDALHMIVDLAQRALTAMLLQVAAQLRQLQGPHIAAAALKL